MLNCSSPPRHLPEIAASPAAKQLQRGTEGASAGTPSPRGTGGEAEGSDWGGAEGSTGQPLPGSWVTLFGRRERGYL